MSDIDRVARAIHDARIFVINADKPDDVIFAQTTLENQNRYRELARAAIAALREPSPATLSASNAEPEIIDRIAKRVYEVIVSAPSFPEARWENAGEANQTIWRSAIRAGLLEAREPTSAMRSAVKHRSIKSIEVIGLGPATVEFNDPADDWRAMIDVAIAVEPL